MYEREDPRITSVRDPAVHAEQRRALSHAFSARALRDQEDVVHEYVDMLLRKLGELGENGEKAVDMTDAYNWLTFDIIGEFALFISLLLALFLFSVLISSRFTEKVCTTIPRPKKLKHSSY